MSKDELCLKWVSEDSASFLEVTVLGEEAYGGTAKKLGCRFLLLGALALLKASLSRAQEAKQLLAWGPEEAEFSSITVLCQLWFYWKIEEGPVSQGPQADCMS